MFDEVPLSFNDTDPTLKRVIISLTNVNDNAPSFPATRVVTGMLVLDGMGGWGGERSIEAYLNWEHNVMSMFTSVASLVVCMSTMLLWYLQCLEYILDL